jgi:cytochrome b
MRHLCILEGTAMAGDSLKTIRVWDLPTRIFHWALALAVLAAFVTGTVGGAAMVWHARMGYGIASLILFRLTWGLIGGHWSRFAAFTFSPRTTIAYARGQTHPTVEVGHSPAGALSVYALLIFLTLQVATGLFGDDRADFSGPLAPLVSEATIRSVTQYHRNIGRFVLIALTVLHIAAIGYYQFFKRRDLLGAMIHGDKHLSLDVAPSRDDGRSRLLAVVVLGLCSALVWWLVHLGGG